MTLKGILATLSLHPEFRRHLAQIDNCVDPPEISIRQGARAAYLAAVWGQRQVPMLVLTPRPEDARRLHDQLLTYLGDNESVHLFPESGVLPFERLAVDARTSNQRLSTLAALASAGLDETEDDDKPRPLVIASVAAALRPPPAFQRVLARSVEALRRQHILEETNAAFAALRSDPQAWEEEQEERRAWDTTFADNLDEK